MIKSSHETASHEDNAKKIAAIFFAISQVNCISQTYEHIYLAK